MSDLVRFELDGAVGVITLDNPPHNLISAAFLEQYIAVHEQAAGRGARALLVRSELRHFCAGADPTALTDRSAAIDAVVLLDRLESIPIPTVAAVHGAVLGGGLELALACDFIVAAESAQIGAVEVTLGLAPLLGGVQRLVDRAGPARGREIAMLGRRYRPDMLERWAIINLVVADDDLPGASLSLARQLAAGPTVALGSIKRLARIASTEGVRAADEALARELAPMWASKDVQRGLESLAKSSPGSATFEGN